MFESANWIGLPEEEYTNKGIEKGDCNGRFAYFRHSFDLKEKGKCERC